MFFSNKLTSNLYTVLLVYKTVSTLIIYTQEKNLVYFTLSKKDLMENHCFQERGRGGGGCHFINILH